MIWACVFGVSNERNCAWKFRFVCQFVRVEFPINHRYYLEKIQFHRDPQKEHTNEKGNRKGKKTTIDSTHHERMNAQRQHKRDVCEQWTTLIIMLNHLERISISLNSRGFFCLFAEAPFFPLFLGNWNQNHWWIDCNFIIICLLIYSLTEN